MAEVEPFVSIRDFFLNMPLYTRLAITDANNFDLEMMFEKAFKFDGFCPHCEQSTIYNRAVEAIKFPSMQVRERPDASYYLKAACARLDSHTLEILFVKRATTITKIGQFPSLADISMEQIGDYIGVLGQRDRAEFHRALGLASHGVGIGAFVYLRRIFERLIYSAFDANKSARGWDEKDFLRQRMEEKIRTLAGLVPDFLLEHKEIYAILGKGIHVLTEQECLAFFEPLKMAILLILQEETDRQKKEKLKQQISEAVKKISG